MPRLGLSKTITGPGIKKIITPVSDNRVLYHRYSAGAVVPVSDGAAYFDSASNTYVGIGNQSNLSFGTGSFSVACWVMTTQTGASKFVLGKGDNILTSSSTGYSLYLGNTGTDWVFSVGDGSDYKTSITATDQNANQWYYICGTFDGVAKTSRLYVDGVLIDTDTDTDIGDIDNTNGFNIGRNADSTSNDWDGYICNVGVWSGVLTQAQIKSIMWKNYAGLIDSEKTNLVSWWNLDVGYDENKHNDVLYGTVFDNHHAGSSSSFGSELVSNGDFSNGTTGWTLEDEETAAMAVVNTGLELQLTDSALYYTHVSTAIPGGFVVGKTYKLEIDIVDAVNENPFPEDDNGFTYIRIGTSNSADEHGTGVGHIHNGNSTGDKDTTFESGAGSYTLYYKATLAYNYLVIGARNDVTSLIFDNVSLKEVLGNTGQTL